jgi:hypothetical protein
LGTINASWTRFTGKYQHRSQMSTKTAHFIADLTKSIQFAEKANTALNPDIFSFTKVFSLEKLMEL